MQQLRNAVTELMCMLIVIVLGAAGVCIAVAEMLR